MGSRGRLLVLFTCVHGILALGAVMYAMAASSSQFDNPDLPRAFGASVAATTADVLLLPGRLVWTSWASKNFPNVVEWLLFIANSALWGALGVAITTRLSGSRNRREVARRAS